MPVSNDRWRGGISYRPQALAHIRRTVRTWECILDIGPGVGTWSKLLPEYFNMDAVEVWAPYVSEFGLKSLYRNVYVESIVTFDFEWYDFIIMGDVLEHLTVEDAQRTLQKLWHRSGDFVIGVPYECPQRGKENRHEEHKQPDLTPEVVTNRYGDFMSLLAKNEGYGYYVKQHTKAGL